MRLSTVTFDTLVRKPDNEEISTQASASKHFVAPAFDLEWKEGKIFITHPSGRFPPNIVPECRVVGCTPIVEKAPAVKKTAPKPEAVTP